MNIADNLIIGVDISSNADQAVISVVKSKGSSIEYINVITGEEALALYTKLTGKKIGGNKNE